MEPLLRFLEDFSFDEQHTWAIYDGSTPVWQVRWVRRDQPKPWRFHQLDGNKAIQLPLVEVETFAAANGIDLDQLQRSITESILTMACFADTFMHQARALVGDELIDTAIAQFDDFAAELKKITAVHASPRPELKVIVDP